MGSAPELSRRSLRVATSVGTELSGHRLGRASLAIAAPTNMPGPPLAPGRPARSHLLRQQAVAADADRHCRRHLRHLAVSRVPAARAAPPSRPAVATAPQAHAIEAACGDLRRRCNKVQPLGPGHVPSALLPTPMPCATGTPRLPRRSPPRHPRPPEAAAAAAARPDCVVQGGRSRCRAAQLRSPTGSDFCRLCQFVRFVFLSSLHLNHGPVSSRGVMRPGCRSRSPLLLP